MPMVYTPQKLRRRVVLDPVNHKDIDFADTYAIKTSLEFPPTTPTANSDGFIEAKSLWLETVIEEARNSYNTRYRPSKMVPEKYVAVYCHSIRFLLAENGISQSFFLQELLRTISQSSTI